MAKRPCGCGLSKMVPRSTGFVLSNRFPFHLALILCAQQARNKRDINRARSLHSIAPQSSLYTPIIDPPSRLPGSIHLNHKSQWYTSALISCALESVTLPTRLRAYHDFESSLAGDDSSHNIFELQSTIIQNQDKYRQQHPATAGVSEDTEDPGSHSAEAQTKFDIDFTYDGFEGERPHVFNQLLVLRGIESQEDETPSFEDTALQRKKRHYDSQPMFQRWVAPRIPGFCGLLIRDV